MNDPSLQKCSRKSWIEVKCTDLLEQLSRRVPMHFDLQSQSLKLQPGIDYIYAPKPISSQFKHCMNNRKSEVPKRGWWTEGVGTRRFPSQKCMPLLCPSSLYATHIRNEHSSSGQLQFVSVLDLFVANWHQRCGLSSSTCYQIQRLFHQKNLGDLRSLRKPWLWEP